MYALKIRKSDLPFLALLNGGLAPEPEKGGSYLIVNPEGENQIVSEKVFDSEYASRISSTGPALVKLNKR